MENQKNIDAARLKAREVFDQQKKKDRRAKFLTIGILAAIILSFVGFGIYTTAQEAKRPVAAPANVEQYAIPVSTSVKTDKTKVPVTVYQDYNCPGCQSFHLANSEILGELSAEGKIDLKYQNVAILDNASSGRDGSIRASNAAACVANDDVENFEEFNHLLYANQMPNHVGMTNEQIIGYAQEAGSDVESCINDETYKQWALKAHADGSSKITHTPTIMIEDEELEDTSNLEEAINEAYESLNA